MTALLPDDDDQYTWRYDEATRTFHRWRWTFLPDGGVDEVRDDPYTFGRACLLDRFPIHHQARLLLLRCRWLDQRLAGSGPDLPDPSLF